MNCVQFSHDSAVVISGGYDKTVRIWDCKSNMYDPIMVTLLHSKFNFMMFTPLQILDESKDSITDIHVNKTQIITVSVDGNVRTYDIRNGSLTTDCIGQPLTSLSVSHDGNCYLLSCLDNTLRLIDRNTGELLNDYTGHVNSDYKISSCFSCDDAFVCSGSEDSLVYVWDLVEAKVIGKLRGHLKPVTSVAYHPKAHQLVSSSSDSTIRIWK